MVGSGNPCVFESWSAHMQCQLYVFSGETEFGPDYHADMQVTDFPARDCGQYYDHRWARIQGSVQSHCSSYPARSNPTLTLGTLTARSCDPTSTRNRWLAVKLWSRPCQGDHQSYGLLFWTGPACCQNPARRTDIHISASLLQGDIARAGKPTRHTR
ncbi:hypothetical protein VUR80DRAFT_2458 [Thermomyces stellatus]